MSHDSWRTPPEFYRVLDAEFQFDLDAAASEENHLCVYWIDKDADALSEPWEHPVVFCNPPYSQIGAFVKRGYEQSQEHCNTVVMLLPAYTDPKYWSEYVMKAHEIRFLKGRLSFLDEDGMKKTSARFPSVVVVFKYIKGEFFGKAPLQFVWDWRV